MSRKFYRKSFFCLVGVLHVSCRSVPLSAACYESHIARCSRIQRTSDFVQNCASLPLLGQGLQLFRQGLHSGVPRGGRNHQKDLLVPRFASSNSISPCGKGSITRKVGGVWEIGPNKWSMYVSVKLGSPKNGKGFHLVSLKGGYTLTKHALIYDHLAINTRTGQANSLVQRATSRSLCQLKFVYTQPTGWNHTSPPYPMLAKRPCRLFAPWKRTEGFSQNPPVSFHC